MQDKVCKKRAPQRIRTAQQQNARRRTPRKTAQKDADPAVAKPRRPAQRDVDAAGCWTSQRRHVRAASATREASVPRILQQKLLPKRPCHRRRQQAPHRAQPRGATDAPQRIKTEVNGRSLPRRACRSLETTDLCAIGAHRSETDPQIGPPHVGQRATGPRRRRPHPSGPGRAERSRCLSTGAGEEGARRSCRDGMQPWRPPGPLPPYASRVRGAAIGSLGLGRWGSCRPPRPVPLTTGPRPPPPGPPPARGRRTRNGRRRKSTPVVHA